MKYFENDTIPLNVEKTVSLDNLTDKEKKPVLDKLRLLKEVIK